MIPIPKSICVMYFKDAKNIIYLQCVTYMYVISIGGIIKSGQPILYVETMSTLQLPKWRKLRDFLYMYKHSMASAK